MTRYRTLLLLAMASLPVGLLVASPARAASLTQVTNSTWNGGAKLPSYVSMYIYVPDKVAAKPAIVVSGHSCGSTASGQMGNIKTVQAAADKNGFILVLPDNPGQNCWDVGSKESLTHDGGGDTQAVAQMVKYALSKYSGDPNRVYIFGGSSGGMLTQAMLAVYPDLFRAGSARAGVPAGCWSDGYDKGQQWSNTCAAGSVTKSAKEWGDAVRAMDPGYTGRRPRVQIMQGDADTTISYKNTAESIKEWTNVLGLSDTPTTKDTTKTSIATYDRQTWTNSCGVNVLEVWSGQGGTHSMAYEEDAILKFFGLTSATSPDPEDACAGGGDAGAGGGAAGASGAGGSMGTGGAKVTDAGAGKKGGGGSTDVPVGTGGRAEAAGSEDKGAGGTTGKGGSKAGSGGGAGAGSKATGTKGGASGGSDGEGDDDGDGETAGSAGSKTSTVGSTKGSGGSKGSGGKQGTGGADGESADDEDVQSPAGKAGGGCELGSHRGWSASTLSALLLGLGLLARRQRRPRA